MSRTALVLVALWAVSVALLLEFSAAEDVDIANLSKLRVKELKKLLDERGVECEGCVEKDHVLKKVEESIHLPVLSEEERAAAKEPKETKGATGSKHSSESAGATGGTSREELERILKRMNLGDNMKMFSRDEFSKYAEDLKGFKEKIEKEEL